MKKTIHASILLALLSLSGCANIPAQSSDEVLGARAQKKECYVVDSLTRSSRSTAPMSVGLGVFGALVPGAGLASAVLAGANAASDVNSQPSSCSMTANDALDAALKLSHMERGITMAKGRSNELEFIIRFDAQSDDCTHHSVSLRDFATSKVFKQTGKVCNKDGVLTVMK